PQSATLRSAALRAYEREKLPVAEAWLNVYRWSVLFGKSEAEFLPRWLEAVQAARVGHSNMAPHYDARARPLAASLTPQLQAWMIGDAKFSAEFFSLLSPVD